MISSLRGILNKLQNLAFQQETVDAQDSRSKYLMANYESDLSRLCQVLLECLKHPRKGLPDTDLYPLPAVSLLSCWSDCLMAVAPPQKSIVTVGTACCP